MSVVYCDYINGDDTTGDGSAGNPYKTIQTACNAIGNNIGGEIRCAKSPDPTQLPGTLTWTDGSDTINTSEDLTGVLSAKDFIGKNVVGETWWEVLSVTATDITLSTTYSGTSEEVVSYKLGTTDTGEAGNDEQVQLVTVSGASGNWLVISGGWDLSSETQTNITWFRQTGDNKSGYGLYGYKKNNVVIDNFGFLRYERGLYYTYTTSIITISNLTANANGEHGIDTSYSTISGSLSNIFSCGNGTKGLTGINLQPGSTASNLFSLSNAEAGLYIAGSGFAADNIVAKRNASSGIQIASCDNSSFSNIVSNNNLHGCYFTYYAKNNVTISDSQFDYNSYDGLYVDDYYAQVDIVFSNVDFNNNGRHGIWFDLNGELRGWSFYDITCNGNTNHGVYIVRAIDALSFANLTCNNNGEYGIYSTNYTDRVVVNGFTASGNISGDIGHNITGVTFCNNWLGEERVYISVQQYNGNVNLSHYGERGTVVSNTAEALSDLCLQISPGSDTYYLAVPLKIAVNSGESIIVDIYMKCSADFIGDAAIEGIFLGRIVEGPTPVSLTTDYAKYSLSIDGADITSNGMLSFRIKVRGTSGSVYADNLSWTVVAS